jgi:multicomponent Na+:H+ antiporter subunit C
MTLVFSAAIGVLFGAGATLMLSRDLLRAVAGTILITNATNLFLVSAGRYPLTTSIDALTGTPLLDPLVQALTLTAIVITFGVTSYLLALAIRVRTTHGTIDLEEIAEAEREEEAALEREREVV